MRPALWSGGDSTTLISQLYGKPRQDVHRLSYVKAPSTRYKLYPQRAVESSELGSFAVFFNQIMARLLTGMRDPSIYQDGTYVVELEPSAPHFAELFHGLSHGSAFPVTWGPHGVVSVPVEQVDKPFPVGTVEILVRDIPVDLQTEAFGEALLSLAGYKVLYPSSTTDPLYPAPTDKTTVYLLGSRWGDNPAGFTHRYNPSICILSVFPHPTDPALHRLPTKLSGQGISPHISCLLRNDPLHPRLHVSPFHPTSGLPETESLPAGWKTSPNNPFTKGALVSYNKSDGTTRQAYIVNVDNAASPPQYEIRCVGDTDPSHHIFTIAERLAQVHQPAYVVKAGCARGSKQVPPRHTDPMVVDSHPLTKQIPMADPLLLKNCFASLENLSLANGHDMEVDEPFLPCPPLPSTTAAKAKQELHRLGRSDATSWRRVVSEASNTGTGALRSQKIDIFPKVSIGSLTGTSAPLPGGAGRNALFHSPMVSGIPKTFVTAAPFPGGVERPLGTTVSKPCSTVKPSRTTAPPVCTTHVDPAGANQVTGDKQSPTAGTLKVSSVTADCSSGKIISESSPSIAPGPATPPSAVAIAPNTVKQSAAISPPPPMRKRIHAKRSDPQVIQEVLQVLPEAKCILKRDRGPSHYPLIPPFGKSCHSSTSSSPSSLNPCKKKFGFKTQPQSLQRDLQPSFPLPPPPVRHSTRIRSAPIPFWESPTTHANSTISRPMARSPSQCTQGGSTAPGLPARGCPT